MEESFLLFNKEVFECYSCINPYFSMTSFNIQDLHFEKGCEKPSPDRILYFYYKTREGKEIYFLYHQDHGFRIFHSLTDMYRCIQNNEHFQDDQFPCLRRKHYRITMEYINHPDGENILHYQGWLKCGHIESNYSYEKIPLITFQEKKREEDEEKPKRQIIDSFQYLFVTPTFYSIFYYEHGKYKIYNAHISSFEKSSY